VISIAPVPHLGLQPSYSWHACDWRDPLARRRRGDSIGESGVYQWLFKKAPKWSANVVGVCFLQAKLFFLEVLVKSIDLAAVLSQEMKLEELGGFNDRIDGDIQADANKDFVRIYPNPDAKGFYYRVPRDAFHAIHEWSPEELLNSQVYGQRRFRVLLKYGQLIQRVQMESVLVGKDALTTKLAGCGEKCSGTSCVSGPSTSRCTITSSGTCVSADPAAGC